MFSHTVLFEIAPKEVPAYRRDCKMWARYASKARGCIAFFIMKRADYKNQYASVYQWRSKADHDRFMKKFHEWLADKSESKVKVLGFYNLNSILHIKPA
ncbi:MAG: antibiotic biosynthesis monooxygenase [Candidatus Omnitrophota bacterium]